MVYLLFDGGNDLLLFCHPGEKEWTRHELNLLHGPSSILYLKNKLHIMCLNPVYYEMQVQGGSHIGDDETLAVGDEVYISTASIAVIESTGMSYIPFVVHIYCTGHNACIV
ncbi:hypothetical protein MKX01_020579 [Papaver californicum]|nr:hypothetical protein MKX01_020579 [Papaver californicum]